MSLMLRKPLLVIFTLLALAGQALVGNGHAMVMSADMDMAETMDSALTTGHPEMADKPHACCDNQDMTMLPDYSMSSCCDGDGFCMGDCTHCLTISISLSLPVANSWPMSIGPEEAQALPLPHFHSIAPTAAFKPPKA